MTVGLPSLQSARQAGELVAQTELTLESGGSTSSLGNLRVCSEALTDGVRPTHTINGDLHLNPQTVVLTTSHSHT